MYSPSRINLLSDQEIEAIYAIPEFNKVERELYFSLTDEELVLTPYPARLPLPKDAQKSRPSLVTHSTPIAFATEPN